MDPANGDGAARAAAPRLLRLAAAAMLAGGATLGFAAPALAHDQLVGTEIVADGEAEAVKLSFSNSIIEVGTEIVITDADGADMTDGAPEVSGPDVTQPIADGLADGAYDVAWRVVSSDGHPIDGAFVFEVVDGTAEIREPASAGDHADESENGSAEADEHSHGDAEHEHADEEAAHGDAEPASAEEPASEDGGTSVGAAIAIAVGGVVVIAGAVTAIMVGQRRRARAMGAAAPVDTEDGDRPGTDPRPGTGTGTDTDPTGRA